MTDTKIKTMEEFASLSGLSRPTVSKYFFDPNSVRQSTRARIEEALARYDYRPNIYAMNQNRRLTRTIGVIAPFLADPFFAEIARRIERMCLDAGFRPIVFSSHGERALEADNLKSLLAMKPAGALLAPLGRNSDQDALAAFCDEVPSILFDSNIEGIGEGFVGLDNHQSVGAIVSYLCESGEPPCFFEGRCAPNPNVRSKLRAYTETMERLGHDPHIVYADGEGWDFEAIGYEAGRRALRERSFATNTVLCGNDRLAVGFLAAAYEEGLRVGRGDGCALRVAGHDDHPFSRFTCPPLTTVSQDFAAIASESMAQLIALLDEDEKPAEERKMTLFQGRLVIRSSA
ncbi:MAG: LacI family DNA-binding transcriptional regulator [Cohaesibacteraceae bacterium]